MPDHFFSFKKCFGCVREECSASDIGNVIACSVEVSTSESRHQLSLRRMDPQCGVFRHVGVDIFDVESHLPAEESWAVILAFLRFWAQDRKMRLIVRTTAEQPEIMISLIRVGFVHPEKSGCQSLFIWDSDVVVTPTVPSVQQIEAHSTLVSAIRLSTLRAFPMVFASARQWVATVRHVIEPEERYPLHVHLQIRHTKLFGNASLYLYRKDHNVDGRKIEASGVGKLYGIRNFFVKGDLDVVEAVGVLTSILGEWCLLRHSDLIVEDFAPRDLTVSSAELGSFGWNVAIEGEKALKLRWDSTSAECSPKNDCQITFHDEKAKAQLAAIQNSATTRWKEEWERVKEMPGISQPHTSRKKLSRTSSAQNVLAQSKPCPPKRQGSAPQLTTTKPKSKPPSLWDVASHGSSFSSAASEEEFSLQELAARVMLLKDDQQRQQQKKAEVLASRSIQAQDAVPKGALPDNWWAAPKSLSPKGAEVAADRLALLLEKPSTRGH